MSVRDILLSAEQVPVPTAAPTPAPTLAPTTPTLYDTMPINMKTGTDDSTWQSICYDGVDTFAAIRNVARTVSFSKSPIAGESWFNANTTGEMLDTTNANYTSICGNAGTFIVTMRQSVTSNTGNTVIQRLKYNPNTDLYDRTAPVKTVTTGSAPSGVLSTVPYGYGQAYCSAYGNGVFVVGGLHWIAYSKDDGVTWTFISTPNYSVYSIVYGEAKTTSGSKVPRFVFTTTVAAPNETVGYCVFDANKDLTVITTQVTGTANGKVAYADGIFMINISTSNRRDFVYTEDLKSFEQAPQLPNPTNNSYNIIDTTYFGVTNYSGGKIVGADKHFLVFPGLSSFYVEPESTTASTTYIGITTLTSAGVLSAVNVNQHTPAQRAAAKFDNQYVYRLSTTRTSTGWTAAWESIPLTYSSEEPVEGWPVVAPETNVSVYGRSAVGPYRAACYGKGVVLAPRWLGDKLTIVDPTIA